MTRKTHQATAVLVTSTACLIANRFSKDTSVITSMVAVGVSVYASLLPDFDTCNSYISHRSLSCLFFLPIWLFHSLIRALSCIPGPFQKALKELSKSTGHRGFSHYPITWVVFFGALWLIIRPFEVRWGIPSSLIIWTRVGASCGIFSHIIGDACFGGVALLYPFVKHKIYFTPFKTSGTIEVLSFVVCIILDALIIKALVIG